MGNLGGGEILVILLVALLVLGPDKLPGAARQVGNVMRQFRSMSLDFRSEFEDALNSADEPIKQSPEELAAEDEARQRGAELIAAEKAAKEAEALEAGSTDQPVDNVPSNPADTAETSETTDSPVVPDPLAPSGSDALPDADSGPRAFPVSEPFAAVSSAAPSGRSMAYRPPGADAGVPDSVCRSCGHDNPKGAKFCSNCGNAVGSAATTGAVAANENTAPDDPVTDTAATTAGAGSPEETPEPATPADEAAASDTDTAAPGPE